MNDETSNSAESFPFVGDASLTTTPLCNAEEIERLEKLADALEKTSAAAYQKARFTKRMAKQIKKEIRYRQYLLREEKKNQKPESRINESPKLAENQDVTSTELVPKSNVHTPTAERQTRAEVAKTSNEKHLPESQPRGSYDSPNETSEPPDIRLPNTINQLFPKPSDTKFKNGYTGTHDMDALHYANALQIRNRGPPGDISEHRKQHVVGIRTFHIRKPV